MEKTIKNATKRWQEAGVFNIVGAKKLQDIKEGQYFYKNKQLCKLKTIKKPFCTYTDIENIEHTTSDLDQKVGVVKWNEEKVNNYGV